MSDPSPLHRLARRLRRRVAATAAARDLNDELQFHLDMEIEHNVRSGLSPIAARAKARRELGAVGEWAGRDPSAGPPPRTPARTRSTAPATAPIPRACSAGARSFAPWSPT